jgi:hypothetical protein
MNKTQTWRGRIDFQNEQINVTIQAAYLGRPRNGDEPHQWRLSSAFERGNERYEGYKPIVSIAEGAGTTIFDRIMEYVPDALRSLTVPKTSPMHGLIVRPDITSIELQLER